MQSNIKQIESLLQDVEDSWSKVRPGKRLVGSSQDGSHFVSPSEDILTVIGRFDSEAEAAACSKAPGHIDQLVSFIRTLVREREEALQGFKEISEKVNPAHKDFESQRPVDMRGVLAVSHHWCQYMLNDSE